MSLKSSKCSQDDAALCQLIAKDPVLGHVMKVIMGKLNETNEKLDETNKKLDSFYTELRRDIDTFQGQLIMLDVPVKMTNDKATGQVVNAKAICLYLPLHNRLSWI